MNASTTYFAYLRSALDPCLGSGATRGELGHLISIHLTKIHPPTPHTHAQTYPRAYLMYITPRQNYLPKGFWVVKLTTKTNHHTPPPSTKLSNTLL